MPSLTISKGGPPVSGRFSWAISRPPFHVALSRTWARLSWSGVRFNFARMDSAVLSLFGHNSMSVRAGWSVYAQQYDSHGAPFYNSRMRWLGVGKFRYGIDRQRSRLQCEDTEIHEQTTWPCSSVIVSWTASYSVPFRYSGRPVMSSRPTMSHFNVWTIASITLYVIHCVNLWNGTISSPSATASALRAEHGQASPSGTPARTTRAAGHTGFNPSMRTCQRAEKGT